MEWLRIDMEEFMVIKCVKCNNICINWAKNKQTCHCGNVLGFSVNEFEITPLAENFNEIRIWDGQLQSWIKYEIERVFKAEFWSGFRGEAFTI
jgi:hypothetical protein